MSFKPLILAALLSLTPAAPLLAAPLDEAVTALQLEWEQIRYQLPTKQREGRFEQLAAKAHRASEQHPGRAEALIWEGIVLSSWAGEKGGLGALGLVKQAKALYEKAIAIDAKAMDGSALNSLGVLYYKVPGWPLGFGDKDKARELLLRALAVNPQGIDANYFYAEFLVESRQPDLALPYLERVLQAPARPGRPLADEGRRDEARALMAQLKKT
ncbi:hypothetical protein [Pseudorhodoferax sp.]|jgi:tetratricopeptide (TPR) repeat protein|uniref:hypothetical protein n=1 Tax=Pseudorhodoferax sp. TaxID=1993553 RepID=UPI001B5750CA|nr:hypothetical protein [Pseudorhodoferax sp.]MBP8143907.1 hypothetical protein [Inhella sp.]